MTEDSQQYMDRRTALITGGTSIAGFLAGCSDSEDEGTVSETRTDSDQGETTETGTDSNQTETVDDSSTPENPGQPVSHPPTPERLRTHLESVPQPQIALDAYDSDLENEELLHRMRTIGINFGSQAVARNNLTEEKYRIVRDYYPLSSGVAGNYGFLPTELVIDHAKGPNTGLTYLDATEDEIISQTESELIDWSEPDETYEGWSILGGGYDDRTRALKGNKIILSYTNSDVGGALRDEPSHSGQKVKDRIDAHEGNEPSILESPAGIGDQLSNVLNALEESGNAEHAGSVRVNPGSEEEPNNQQKSYTWVDIINFFPDDTTNNYEGEIYPSGDAEWTEEHPRRPIREDQELS